MNLLVCFEILLSVVFYPPLCFKYLFMLFMDEHWRKGGRSGVLQELTYDNILSCVRPGRMDLFSKL